MELRLLFHDGDFVRFDLNGKLSRDGWTIDGDPIEQLCGPDVFGRRLLLNMQHVLHVDSTGVEWLLATHKKCENRGGVLVLHSLGRLADQMLRMMRMDLVLNIETNEDAARTFALSRGCAAAANSDSQNSENSE